MVEELIIPEKYVGTKLLCYLNPNRFNDQKNRSAVELLHRICFANLTDFGNSEHIKDLVLTDEERNIVLDNKWNSSANLEVKAKCNDVLSRFESDKRNIKILASDTYLAAFKEFGEIDFLIRSVTVRDFKQINTEKFFQDVTTVVLEREIPSFWLKKFIESLLRSYSIEELDEIATYIDSKRIESNKEKQFIDERNYIQALKMLRYFDDNVYHKLLALSFESEADTTAENKKTNTYYPNLVDGYQNAFNEIVQINEIEPIIFERIKKKLLVEKKVFMEMLSLGGVKIKIEVPDNFIKSVEDIISNIVIRDFVDTIKLMLNIPFVSKQEVDKYEASTRRATITQYMFGQTQLDTKGNIVGNADPKVALRTEAHIYFRQKRLYLIQRYLYLHKWAKIKSEEAVIYHILKNKKPKFVKEDDIIFWTKGIHAGLNGDFITASFVLTPQIEHAFLNMAEIKEGDITSLEKKRQLSPTLGAILPRLIDVFDKEVYFEISSFLQGETDVNFRNNLLHGLLTPFEVDKYGVYLWWICLKLYFYEESCDKNMFGNILT